ncbi:putative acetyltransferase (GNAT) family protein [Lyophyllum shimeji]|uniref:Acetyltransferase (GNAT) family protein n=1 Tax=Lyophyllum shimeji TaxID=47721 RepID=A0A9P3Q1C0_LYOSH|nr:putative acetyltransferase (GNAT) family protein [Lyophyllum shimeji]
MLNALRKAQISDPKVEWLPIPDSLLAENRAVSPIDLWTRMTLTPGENLPRQDLDVICRQITVEQTLQLRHSVLWPEKPVSHVYLPEDDRGLHMGAFIPSCDQPIAVISFFVEPAPINDVFKQEDIQRQARFRKFACEPAFQGRGIGSRLLQNSFERARSQLNCTVAWCDARTSTAQWYMKRGMTPFGERFSKGPVEYIRMYIDISASVPVYDADSLVHVDR